MVSDRDSSFVPILVSLSLSLFPCESLNINGIPLIIVVANFVDLDLSRRRGYSNLLGFFLRRVKEETKNIFISSVFVLD